MLNKLEIAQDDAMKIYSKQWDIVSSPGLKTWALNYWRE